MKVQARQITEHGDLRPLAGTPAERILLLTVALSLGRFSWSG